MDSASDSVRNQLLQSAQSLGIGGAEQTSFADLAKQLSDAQGVNAYGGAGAEANLANLGADLESIMGKEAGDSQREFAQYQNELANMVLRNIGEMQYGAQQEKYNLQGLMADLEGNRGRDLATTLYEVQNATSDRERQKALDALAAEIQRGTLGLQQASLAQSGAQFDKEFGLSQDQFEFSKEQQRAQYDLQLQQLQMQRDQTNDPLVRKRAQAEIDRINAEINAITNSTNLESLEFNLAANAPPEDAEGRQYKGAEGVRQYVSDFGINPNLANTFETLYAEAAMGGASSNLESRLFRAITENFPDPETQRTLRTLYQIYSNDYSSFAP
jgi:hypothetical protein